MTIREIAAIAGVSPAAVSLVLNNKKGVSEQTRERIKKVLSEYNYTPATQRKKEPRCRIRLIKYSTHGMAVEENQGFVATIIDHIESECRRYSYDLIMCGCNNKTAEETFKMIAQDPMDGVILLGSEFEASQFYMLKDIKEPIIVVDNSMKHQNVDSIVMANESISHAAVNYLYGLGHRKIGYFLTNVKISNFTERYKGYLEALEELGLTPPEPVLLTPTLNGSYMDMKKLLESGAYVPEGAVLAGNDSIAIGAVRAIQEAGYKVPEDISVIGVDDIPYSSMMVPPLTTMRISRTVMGNLTVSLLRERMKHPDSPFMHMTISAQLVERGSTAPAK
ncbi:MAG: LacI family DNA-binding transcriptional regulator [Burkholderiales bacterium]